MFRELWLVAMPKSRKTGICVLAFVALTLRVTTVWLLADPATPPYAFEHGEIARNLVEGRGFTVTFLGSEGPTSQQAPWLPMLLAGLFRVFGTGSPLAFIVLELLQCLAGTALVLCVVWLAWSLVPDRPLVGWIAGWGAAVYPPHVYMVTHVQVAVWAALFLTLLLAIAVSPRNTGSWPIAAACGVLAGLLMLVDPILVVALPFVAGVLWQSTLRAATASSQSFVARLVPLGTFALTAGLVLAPWLVRNARVHGEWVFVKSTFGYAFWQGNNPASWGTDKIPQPQARALRTQHDGSLAGMHRAAWDARLATSYIDDVLLAPSGYRQFAGLTEPQRSRLLQREAWDFVCNQPEKYVALCLQRLRYFLLFDETNPKAASTLYRASTVVWLLLSSLGLLLMRSRWKSLWPTIGIFAAVMVFHTLTIVSARFRIPVEPLSFVWAAGCVALLAERLMPDRRPARRLAPPLIPLDRSKTPVFGS
jgi:hypothetical protein